MEYDTDYNVGNMMFSSQAHTTVGLRTYVTIHANISSRVRKQIVNRGEQLSTPSNRYGKNY
jgi:hypothetical protein